MQETTDLTQINGDATKKCEPATVAIPNISSRANKNQIKRHCSDRAHRLHGREFREPGPAPTPGPTTRAIEETLKNTSTLQQLMIDQLSFE